MICGGSDAELSAEDKANLVASLKVRSLLHFLGAAVRCFFGWVLGGIVLILGGVWGFLDELILIRCLCACLEHARGIGVAAYGRARRPRAQGQEACREAQGDPGIDASTFQMQYWCFCDG